jgi:hypothetical protein
VFAGAHRERSFEYVPRLVVLVVDVQRRNVERRRAAATTVAPLRENERGAF